MFSENAPTIVTFKFQPEVIEEGEKFRTCADVHGGIVFLVSGISGIVVAPFVSDFGGVSAGIGIVFLILGIPYLVITYGLWKGKIWA